MSMVKDKKLKILEICEFSAGICGVWQRVKQESELLAEKDYNVTVFSSNIVKGTDSITNSQETINKVNINRFPHKTGFLHQLLTRNVTYFDFEDNLISLNPDIVITHTIHPHSFKALKICKEKNIPCFLVTHAPFDIKRKFPLNLITSLYYLFNVKSKINNFNKIIAITKWEVPYLLELGLKKEKIAYIPNGIPKEFFKEKIKKFEAKKIIFLGRIAPVKDIETLIKAFKNISSKRLNLEIVGPVEKGYENIKEFGSENIKFCPPIYDLKKKIKKIQEADIFVLPSKREAMPQALIEAMSLGKIVISSKTGGGKEIIQDGKNGLLFEVGDYKRLAEKILFCLDKKNAISIKEMQKAARKRVYEFNWEKLIKKLGKLIRNSYK